MQIFPVQLFLMSHIAGVSFKFHKAVWAQQNHDSLPDVEKVWQLVQMIQYNISMGQTDGQYQHQ